MPATPEVLKADWKNEDYTAILSTLLDLYGRDLLKAQPSDREKYCSKASSAKACWVAIISGMSRYESNHRTESTYKEDFKNSKGEFIISAGLLQVSHESCNSYGAEIKNTEALKEPAHNLRCGILILNKWVPKDEVIAGGEKSAWRGGARYWAVLRNKQAQIQVISRALTK